MCSPNYSKDFILGSTKPNSTYVEELLLFLKSIFLTWKFEFTVNIFHTVNFNNEDLQKIKEINTNIYLYLVEPDDGFQKAYCRYFYTI